MNYLRALVNNSVLQTAVIAWFIAQVIKVITNIIKYKKLDFERFIGAGGMPSSHSSFVTSLAISVGAEVGFDSVFFAIACCFALVTMYDAAGVRNAAGKQARVLNQMAAQLEENGQIDFDVKLKELLGHTPLQVFMGALLGFAIAALRYF